MDQHEQWATRTLHARTPYEALGIEGLARRAHIFPMTGLELRARARGARQLLLSQLRRRFGELDDELITRVEAGTKDELDRWAERVLDAETPEDVLA